MTTRRIVIYFLIDIFGVAAMGVALFWSAGRIDWWPAWAAILVWLASYAVMDSIVIRFNPDLMAERLAPPKDGKTWDRSIVSILRLVELARYILAGLDQRYGWTGGFPIAVQIAALILCILGQALFVWALTSNAFFSQVVRIQSDRGHAVVTAGPYRFVRHPGYAGMALFELAIATLLASWWALLASGVCVVLIVWRTALEDRTLQAELPGYAEYARQVRYRMVPGLW